MSLDFKGWQRIDANHMKALFQTKTSYYSYTGSQTTTSATFVSLPSGAAVSFTKLYTVTQLRIEYFTYPWITGAVSTAIEYAMLINGTDYTIAAILRNELGLRDLMSGVLYCAGGLAAGTYTIQPRWRRSAGTGTANMDATTKSILVVMEAR
jgi:hypothetical protein